jgi:hypothetical protein
MPFEAKLYSSVKAILSDALLVKVEPCGLQERRGGSE